MRFSTISDDDNLYPPDDTLRVVKARIPNGNSIRETIIEKRRNRVD